MSQTSPTPIRRSELRRLKFPKQSFYFHQGRKGPRWLRGIILSCKSDGKGGDTAVGQSIDLTAGSGMCLLESV